MCRVVLVDVLRLRIEVIGKDMIKDFYFLFTYLLVTFYLLFYYTKLLMTCNIYIYEFFNHLILQLESQIKLKSDEKVIKRFWRYTLHMIFFGTINYNNL